jgi:Uma2 family endonuclease
MVLEPGHPREQIITRPPAICIEVISPADTWKRLRNLFTDFWTMGVRNIWAFEPEDRLAFRFDADGLHPVRDPELVTLDSQIRLNVTSVFWRLDSNHAKV